MPQPPIEDHGVIGNMRTAALINKHGAVDWLCFPYFDSPSIFASILDEARGGQFIIEPASEDYRVKQVYWSDTNVLRTRFLTPQGAAEVVDFMPLGTPGLRHETHTLVRQVTASRGSLTLRMCCTPRFDYGAVMPSLQIEPGMARFASSQLRLALRSSVNMSACGDAAVHSTFTLEEGQTAVFVLGRDGDEVQSSATLAQQAHAWLMDTVCYWRRWLEKSTYRGRWREGVHRSALALKLLTFEPTGAIVAAPTCSLPENLGGARNWDYRYAWVRDAAFTVYALIRIGFTDEALGFMQFMARCFGSGDGTIQVVYGIDGRKELPERILSHLRGYKDSGPVRVGNAAYQQLQLDVYGELMDAIYLANKYAMPLDFDGWKDVRRALDWLQTHWQQPDEGIWEVRGGRQHFVYSKLMCWVAFDRAIRLADKRSFPGDRDAWLRSRDTIYEEIMQQGYDAKRESFVQAYGNDALDASVLIMPLVFFVAPSDRRMLKTLKAIMRPPAQGGLLTDGMLYRYDTSRQVDGLQGGEGTFNLSTFWLVEALTRAGRTRPEYLGDARTLFERMLGHANHLGLYSEQIGQSGEALGNFPQAFTHLALISAAYNLDAALG